VFYALHVSESWLISTTAKRVYVAAALLTVFFFALLLTIIFVAIAEAGSLPQLPLLAVFLRGLLFLGVLGNAVLWVGMWYFWFRYHPNDGMSKALWAGLFLILGSIGSLIYFLLVYLRAPEVRASANQESATA
jgi:hypothetical protein